MLLFHDPFYVWFGIITNKTSELHWGMLMPFTLISFVAWDMFTALWGLWSLNVHERSRQHWYFTKRKTKAPPNNFDVKNVEYICLICLHGLPGRWFRLLNRLKPSMLNAMCQLMMVTSKHNLHYFRNIRNWNYLFLIAYILKRHVLSSWQAHDGWQAHDVWDALADLTSWHTNGTVYTLYQGQGQHRRCDDCTRNIPDN